MTPEREALVKQLLEDADRLDKIPVYAGSIAILNHASKSLRAAAEVLAAPGGEPYHHEPTCATQRGCTCDPNNRGFTHGAMSDGDVATPPPRVETGQERCADCGHTSHARGRCWVAVGQSDDGYDSMAGRAEAQGARLD